MFASLLAYALALGLAAAIPGPGVAAVVGQSMGNGLRSAMFLLGGLCLGDVFYLTVAVAGLSAIALAFSGIFTVVKVLGGLYLLYLAYRLWQSQSGLIESATARRQSDLAAFTSGFSLTLGNPKTIIFYLALLPTVLDLNRVGLGQWALMAVVTVVVLFITLTPYAVLAASARSLLKRPKALRRLNRSAAGIIGGTGLLILGQAAMSLARGA
ncbi:LysE family translocator [Xinfangfangia sp. CPCC 101601]|uniref:LysE family translocator n=1 Tax=Pseudogemmobacter lacusdianii TaxID=3069608 RepID=A0ABU0VXH1_9RHOB|nr:LysE family translocator [Xinfangfangia sp. CPCC 101601]MDQ2066457.1 LysE family translocator [Xinfangfangia sp. CPCC 101601]